MADDLFGGAALRKPSSPPRPPRSDAELKTPKLRAVAPPSAEGGYDASTIEVLEGLEPVRERRYGAATLWYARRLR